MARQVALDFTNVKEGGGQFSKKHKPEGDYLARITKVEDAESKSDQVAMWLYTIQLEGDKRATYPYYCKLVENQLWKIRNMFGAAGIAIPKKRTRVNPDQVVGKVVAVTLEDEEYKGSMQSVVQAVFPPSELAGDESEDPADDEPDEDEDVDEPDEDEDEDEGRAGELAALDRPALKVIAKELGVKVLKSMSDDDLRVAVLAAEEAAGEGDDEDEDEEEEAPPPPPAKKKKRQVKEEDLDELDVDEV